VCDHWEIVAKCYYATVDENRAFRLLRITGASLRSHMQLSPRAGGRARGRAGSAQGRTDRWKARRLKTMTKEQRRKVAAKAAKARWKKRS